MQNYTILLWILNKTSSIYNGHRIFLYQPLHILCNLLACDLSVDLCAGNGRMSHHVRGFLFSPRSSICTCPNNCRSISHTPDFLHSQRHRSVMGLQMLTNGE
ncbi:hypothetical protein PG_0542 [Porphyromonas gingivalis W83]|uniref:Uncharacterized protein n=1 Tax=Porphyromonas gingivalis (strain ATCC BAA-308 / W83) TaxID=242619 RepID=Q7MWQ4_PORGI|nr:hypothetical protein PG_0542 [Porphyromonas gingivalis W83]